MNNWRKWPFHFKSASKPKQQLRAELSGKLANKLNCSSCTIIMDDKKYFTFSGQNMPGNAGYYSKDKSKCPDKVWFTGKDNFSTDVLVCIIISARGLSKPLICPRPQIPTSTSTNVWRKDCYHSFTSIKLILHDHPDLASSH